MSWIAEYDTQGREFPTCVHVTKTTGSMTHGVTYVPIEDGKAVRAENAKLRELVKRAQTVIEDNCALCDYFTGCTILQDGRCAAQTLFRQELRELGVDDG